MLFTDALFLFYFLPLALFIHRITNLHKTKGPSYPVTSRIVLFSFTLFFYGYKQPWWLIPFAISIVFDFVWASLISKTRSAKQKKLYCTLSVVQNLGLLALFKYQTFFILNLKKISPHLAAAFPQILQDGIPLMLPAGISFYTFESMSFVIDVYRGKTKAPKHFHEFFAFIGMFPRFIAGPIVRYSDMISQFQFYRGMQIEAGLFLFSIGLFLKCCLADSFAFFVSYGFSRTEQVEFLSAWAGMLSYTMQIYFDFSGYSLMAIGLGRCFGFQFPTNFKAPYTSTSIQEFWTRWHISLSTWLRDYLYISLGGNREGKWKTYRNLFLTMLLGGLWHGAEWTFVIWGAWHGLALGLERKFQWNQKLNPRLSQFFTFLIVLIGWVFFRARKIPEATKTLATLFNPFRSPLLFNPEALLSNRIPLFFCVLGILYCFVFERRWKIDLLEKQDRFSTRQQLIGLLLLTTAVLTAMSSKTIPFLYFQF